MLLRCKKCTYEWDYKGNSKYWATCPRCLAKINLQKKKKRQKIIICNSEKDVEEALEKYDPMEHIITLSEFYIKELKTDKPQKNSG